MDLPFKIDLKGKTAVVTGAGGILCSDMARALALCGAKVAVADRNLEAAQAVVSLIAKEGGEAMALAFDVLDIEAVKKGCAEILGLWGKVDILINGAGGNSPRATTSMEYCTPEGLKNKKEGDISFFDLKFDDMAWVMNLNLFGTVLPSQVFGEAMAKAGRGNIINISSMNSYRPLTKIPMYSAGKAAVSNFTQWLAVHFAPVNVRVNAIAPGFFETNQNKKLLRNEDGSPTARSAKILRGTPMDKFGVPADLLGSVLFLASDEASGFITGTIMPIDGGFSAYAGV